MIEHVNKFLDSMGPFAGNGDLCLREFSKSLTDHAYTWYSTLHSGSIAIWDDMVESFCSKYFLGEEKVTILTLHNTKQSPPKDSLISSGGSEMLHLIVMGSSKSKSWLRFALTTCLMSIEPIWRILILFSLPSCSRKLVIQQY